MSDVKFTIATLVNDHDQYRSMRDTFASKGFGDSEFLVLDNAEKNVYDGYTGYNWALQRARGEFVILCHQDVRLDFDDRDMLEARLAELEELDPTWAVAGNAGGLENGSFVIRISDPDVGIDFRLGEFPSRVCSLDENFILVKNETRVAFSRDLHGFHLYGSDICLQAEMRGYRAYAIDFHLRHLSNAKVGQAFFDAKASFLAKWQHALRRRQFRAPFDLFPLEGADGTAELSLNGGDFVALSLTKYLEGDYHGCVAAALSAIELRPDLVNARINLCAAYNNLEMYEEARDAGEQAVRLSPDNQLARANLAWTEMKIAARSKDAAG